jgi:dihydrofolate synthase/folylpolyglutamate synthase
VADIDFSAHVEAQQWHWSNATIAWRDLPHPALAGHYQLKNAAAVLQVISLLIDQGFSISQLQIEQGLKQVKLAGRFQQIPGPVMRIYDVTHNQQGALNLAELLTLSPCQGRTIAVLAMLKDKDVSAVSTILEPVIDLWHIAGLTGSRGMSAEILALQLAEGINADRVSTFDTVPEAYTEAMTVAEHGDRVLIFGSFHTVESVMILSGDTV